MPDIFGLKGLQKEPVGIATVESLKQRASRRHTLDEFPSSYAFDPSIKNRDELAELLRRAAARLGPPAKQANFRDPEFIVVHALNLIDPRNWRKQIRQTEDGPSQIQEYVAPISEMEHLQPFQDEARERQAKFEMEKRIRLALYGTNKSSPAFAAAAVEWAEKQPSEPVKCQDEEEDIYDDPRNSIHKEIIVSAAMIAARDGGPELIAAHEPWIRETLIRELTGRNDPVHRVRSGLQFNPMAIAFVGMVLLVRNRFNLEDVQSLLQSAGNENPAAARGFAVSAALLAEIDERLPRALLHCAFAACAKHRRDWHYPESAYLAQVESLKNDVGRTVAAELSWLTGKQEEPEWPEFHPSPARAKHRFMSRGQRAKQKPVGEATEPNVYTDHQAAALWLDGAAAIFDADKRPWLREVVKTYGRWTYVANGAELEEDEETDHEPSEWNDAFFKLLAYCLPGLTSAQIEEIALIPIKELPDYPFFDVTTAFLRHVDVVYFNDGGLEAANAVHIRSSLWTKIMTTRAWNRHVRDHSTSTEYHFGPAVARITFNDYGGFSPAKCYLFAKAIDNLDPFLPVLKEIAENGQFFLVIVTLLNLLEVSPRESHLPVVVTAGRSWLTIHPDDKEFWVSQGIGRRLCSVMQTIFALNEKPFGPEQPFRKDIEHLLANLIRIGVAEAHRLEENLLRLTS